MVESERSGARSNGGAAGSESGRALLLPELRRRRHVSAAFIAETRAGGPPGRLWPDQPIRSGSGHGGWGFLGAGLAGGPEAGGGGRAPAPGLAAACSCRLPAAHRAKTPEGKVQSVRKLSTPCLSGLQAPSGVPGGEATSQRPPCGPGTLLPPTRGSLTEKTRLCGSGAERKGDGEAIGWVSAGERVNVLCSYRADEKLRQSGRAAKSTAPCLHLTVGVRLPSSIDRDCARL